MIFKIFIKSGLDHGLDLIWEDIFNSGNCGEQPSKGVKVLCGDSMGTEGCASGRLDVLYGRISLIVAIAGELPSKGVKVLCGDSMGTEGCASGRLDVLYYLSGSVWKLIFSKNQVLEPSGFEPV